MYFDQKETGEVNGFVSFSFAQSCRWCFRVSDKEVSQYYLFESTVSHFDEKIKLSFVCFELFFDLAILGTLVAVLDIRVFLF